MVCGQPDFKQTNSVLEWWSMELYGTDQLQHGRLSFEDRSLTSQSFHNTVYWKCLVESFDRFDAEFRLLGALRIYHWYQTTKRHRAARLEWCKGIKLGWWMELYYVVLTSSDSVFGSTRSQKSKSITRRTQKYRINFGTAYSDNIS